MPPRPVHPAWIFLSLLVVLGTARADDLLSYDFEAGADLARYDRLSFDRGVDARIAEPGMGDAGACLQMGNREPARYANLTLRGPFTMVRNLTVAFDVKAASEVPDAGQYVGFLAYEGDKQFFGQAPFDGQWHHVEAAIAGLHPTNGGTLRLGQVFDRITIYGRAKNDHDSRMTVWLDNLHLFAAPPASRLSDQVRTSYANPPFLDWRADGTPQQLALSRDPAFPEGATQTFAVQHAWFTPPKPLEPGTWYWKVLATGELADGWSETRRVVIPPETHSFQPRPLPLAELAGRPHPRLVDVAAERGKLDAAGLAALVKQAENEHRQGIADDCPIWVEGDPRWPTWIDWYGKAHGGITSAAGTRLARIGRICALTGDPQVIAWTRELALKAARWDPEGGSNYRRGDIGAHHFLRGLNWCYDALYVHLDETDRTTLRTALVARAEQFWKALAPFPGGENNNHAW
ncbi:MAG: DUF4962 domain-containing protein, partial [Armatimonadetes bacterium]|nr:DUF4962 domain-containing protein [Armatimonadota bacterium]